MTVRGWWERMRSARRKRLQSKRLRPGPRRLMAPLPKPALPAPEDPIQARVDMVRFGAFAEAAAETMETGSSAEARARYDEACLYFGRAIEAALRAGLSGEAAEFKARRTALRRVFDAIRKAEIRNRKPD